MTTVCVSAFCWGVFGGGGGGGEGAAAMAALGMGISTCLQKGLPTTCRGTGMPATFRVPWMKPGRRATPPEGNT